MFTLFKTPVIKLEKRQREPRKNTSVVDMNVLYAVAACQKELGFGYPAEQLNYYKSQEISKELQQAAKLAEVGFTPIKQPKFPRPARDGWYAQMYKIIMHPLDGITTIKYMSLSAGTHRSAMPIIPMSVQELARRAKAICPDMIFHMILMPEWRPDPSGDPVIVGMVPKINEWFQIGYWDGDAELINEILGTKQGREDVAKDK